MGLGALRRGRSPAGRTRAFPGCRSAPAEPPLGRRLAWAKADAELIDGEASWPLFTNRWSSGAIGPAGYVHIESFHLDGAIPVWLFAIGLIRIEARIWLEPGANKAYAAWRLLPGSKAPPETLSLRVRLMVNDRD